MASSNHFKTWPVIASSITLKSGKVLDLSQPFFETEREGDDITVHINMPNDTVGDQVFEWDFDGSQRAEWQAWIKKLEEEGRRGDLEYITIYTKYNPIFDNPRSMLGSGPLPLQSYSLYFIP